jgi:hypothetical protein
MRSRSTPSSSLSARPAARSNGAPNSSPPCDSSAAASDTLLSRYDLSVPFTPADFCEIVEHDREWLEWLIGATNRGDEREHQRCVGMLPIRMDALRN